MDIRGIRSSGIAAGAVGAVVMLGFASVVLAAPVGAVQHSSPTATAQPTNDSVPYIGITPTQTGSPAPGPTDTVKPIPTDPTTKPTSPPTTPPSESPSTTPAPPVDGRTPPSQWDPAVDPDTGSNGQGWVPQRHGSRGDSVPYHQQRPGVADDPVPTQPPAGSADAPGQSAAPQATAQATDRAAAPRSTPSQRFASLWWGSAIIVVGLGIMISTWRYLRASQRQD